MNVHQLKQAKKEKKMTYEQLSKISGVPISTIYDIFREVTIAPRIDTIQAIEKALGLNQPTIEWTEADKAQGVGNYPTYLSEEDMNWLEIKSEILRVHGKQYLETVITMLQALTKNK